MFFQALGEGSGCLPHVRCWTILATSLIHYSTFHSLGDDVTGNDCSEILSRRSIFLGNFIAELYEILSPPENSIAQCYGNQRLLSTTTQSFTPRQGCSHQIWSSQVGSVGAKMLYSRGLGACSPRKFLKFRGYAIVSETLSEVCKNLTTLLNAHFLQLVGI